MKFSEQVVLRFVSGCISHYLQGTFCQRGDLVSLIIFLSFFALGEMKNRVLGVLNGRVASGGGAVLALTLKMLY